MRLYLHTHARADTLNDAQVRIARDRGVATFFYPIIAYSLKYQYYLSLYYKGWLAHIQIRIVFKCYYILIEVSYVTLQLHYVCFHKKGASATY